MHHYRNNIAAQLKAVPLVQLTAQVAASLTAANIDKAYDRTGFESMLLLLATGASSGAPDSFSVTTLIKHSDTLLIGDFTTLTDKDGNNVGLTSIAASQLQSLAVNLAGAKKYIAIDVVVAFVGGTTPTISGSAVAVLGGADETGKAAPTAVAVT